MAADAAAYARRLEEAERAGVAPASTHRAAGSPSWGVGYPSGWGDFYQPDYYPGSYIPPPRPVPEHIARAIARRITTSAGQAPELGFAETERAPVRLGAASRSESPTTARSPASPVREQVVRPALQGAALITPYRGTLAACTRQALVTALDRTGGNKRRAARALGMSRSGFYDALARVGLPTTGA